MHVALYVKWPLQLSSLNETWSPPLHVFVVKFSNTKFCENLAVPETLNAYRWTVGVIFIQALEGCKDDCKAFFFIKLHDTNFYLKLN
jgi:hypothetical protein